jgi:hypothetical protein
MPKYEIIKVYTESLIKIFVHLPFFLSLYQHLSQSSGNACILLI